MNIYFTSDQHFFHFNILKYCNRPFVNEYDMNTAIIKNYNMKVRDEDIVFYLGDLGLRDYENIKSVIQQLKGKKILIRGNHDRWGTESYYNMGFNAVFETASIKVGKLKLTMAHYPRRTLWQIVKIFWFYINKMRIKGRDRQMIIDRLKREWRQYNQIKGDYHLCGHTHTKQKYFQRNIDVGVDSSKFFPVGLKEILLIIERHNND